MNLLIVIVNFRVAPLVVDCLRSIATELPKVPGTRVVVFENASGDDSAAIIDKAIKLEGWQDWCRLKVSNDNLGFTGGNNVPIAEALRSDGPPRYVLLLNPDTVVRPGAFSALINFMDQNPKVGIVGSRLEEPDETPQRSAFRFKSPLGEFEASAQIGPISRLLRRWIVAPPVVDHPIEADWVSGASMMVRREVLEEVGLLDEGYFTYFDDIDFCFNAKKHGWPIWYVPESRVVHLVGQSTGVDGTPRRLPSYLLEARRRYFLKNHSASYAAFADAGAMAGALLARLRELLTNWRSNLPSRFLEDSFRHSVFVKGFHLPKVKPPSTVGK